MNNEASKHSHTKKKIEHEQLTMENEYLRKKVASLQNKVNKLKTILKEKQESFEVLEHCLEKQREADLITIQSLDSDEDEELQVEEGVTEGTVNKMQQSVSNYRKMTKLNKDEFEQLLVEVEMVVMQTTFRGAN